MRNAWRCTALAGRDKTLRLAPARRKIDTADFPLDWAVTHCPCRAMSSGYRNHYKNRLNWFSGAIAMKKNKQKMTIRAPSIPLDERKLYFYRDSIA
jgi:hypothetical protein